MPCSRCIAAHVVITVALVAFTALALASHFVKQMKSGYQYSVDFGISRMTRLQVEYYYSREVRTAEMQRSFVSVAGSNTVFAADLLKSGDKQLKELGQAMVAAQFCAAMGTFMGLLAAVASAAAVFLACGPCLQCVRVVFTALAFIFCVVTAVVVAAGFHGKLSANERAAIAEDADYSSYRYSDYWQLIEGFALICAALGGYFLLLVTEVVLLICTLAKCCGNSRAAFRDDVSVNDAITYGTQFSGAKD